MVEPPSDKSRTPLLLRLLVVAGPLVGLGNYLWGLKQQKIAISIITFVAVLVIIYLSRLFISPFRTAVRQVLAALATLGRGAIGAYAGLPSILAKLVFGFSLLVAFGYLAYWLGLIGGFYLTEEERTAVGHLKTADTCLERDDYICANSEIVAARALLPNDLRVYEADIRSRVLKLTVDRIFFRTASDDDIRRVKTDCESLLNRNPTDPRFRSLLGIVYSLLDDPYAAEEQFRKAINSSPSYANTHNYFGFDLRYWQISAQWPDEARSEFEAAASFNPKYSMPLVNLAWLTLITDQTYESTFKKAENYLLRARDVAPDDQRVYVSLGALYSQWGNWLKATDSDDEAAKKYAFAEDALEKGYRFNPKNPFLLLNFGEVLVARNASPERVIQLLRRLLKNHCQSTADA